MWYNKGTDMRNGRNGRTLVELLVGIAIGGILLSILIPGCMMVVGGNTGMGKGYSEGSRTGMLIKMSNKGYFYKSYEGELQLVEVLVFNKNSTTDRPFGYWGFSTNDEKLGKRLEGLVGKNVKIKYSQYIIRPIGFSTNYEVVEVEELK